MPTPDPLSGYTLTPEEIARMRVHLEGGGSVGAWQMGDRPPSASQYETMSQAERDALGLSTPESYAAAGQAWRQGFAARQPGEQTGPTMSGVGGYWGTYLDDLYALAGNPGAPSPGEFGSGTPGITPAYTPLTMHLGTIGGFSW